jgi:serine/threonine protein kinase
MTTSVRRSDADIRQFEAPSSFAQDLQAVLADLVELHLQGKQARDVKPANIFLTQSGVSESVDYLSLSGLWRYLTPPRYWN